MTRHEQRKRLLQERLWTARVGWRGAAVPAILLALARVPGSWVRVALDGFRHAFSWPTCHSQATACNAVNDVFDSSRTVYRIRLKLTNMIVYIKYIHLHMIKMGGQCLAAALFAPDTT